jgi:hypothetical protein
MQEENELDITKKDDYIQEVAQLRVKYKENKEKLDWAEDDMEEFFIQEEMDKYASSIRGLNKKIASIQKEEQLS